MSTIKISKQDQFHHEHKTWTRLLEFFKQENAFLKNRLAEVVDTRMDKEFLSLAEQFQNKLIIKDEYIDELRHDINVQDQDLKNKAGLPIDEKVNKFQEKLRHEIAYFENDFNNLKNEFNKYLSTLI